MHKLTNSIVGSSSFRMAVFSLVFSVSLIIPAARAEDFCAVTLNVVAADGRPITSTWIDLVDPSGNVVRREQMHGSTLRICDFGFGPHELRVGTNECLPVTISNIRLVFGSPLFLNVTLNACSFRERMGNACLLYFRVTDEAGRPVPAAEFSPRFPAQEPRVDSFGRFQSLFGGTQDFTFVAPGFQPTTVRAQCKETEEIDQMVVMRHTPGK